MIAAQQRYSDTRKTIVVGETIVVAMPMAHHFVNPHHASERAGNSHRNDDLFANRDAAILSCRWARASGAQLIPPLRAPKKEIDQNATDQSQDESEVQW